VSFGHNPLNARALSSLAWLGRRVGVAQRSLNERTFCSIISQKALFVASRETLGQIFGIVVDGGYVKAKLGGASYKKAVVSSVRIL